MSASAGERPSAALDLLRLVHERPGISRSDAARVLGLSSSSATEITARLSASRLLEERERAPQPGRGRGRPSGCLFAHPVGPVVLAAEITHAGWRVAAVEVGGGVLSTRDGVRPRRPQETLAEIRRALNVLHGAFGDRVRALGVSVAGTVSGNRITQAATLRWQDVALGPLVPRALRDRPLCAGNDATLAGLAEARRGVAAGAAAVLYLAVEVGIGGVLVVDGNPVAGARGEGGEFGHMPFGHEELRCPCGARGCWDLEVDGRAMARSLGRRAPANPLAFGAGVIATARRGGAAEGAAVAAAARALGRGTGALVNALDPDLVVYGGLAPDLRDASRSAFDAAFAEALMQHRRAQPPPIAASSLGQDAALTGAAERAFELVLTPPLLAARTQMPGRARER